MGLERRFKRGSNCSLIQCRPNDWMSVCKTQIAFIKSARGGLSLLFNQHATIWQRYPLRLVLQPLSCARACLPGQRVDQKLHGDYTKSQRLLLFLPAWMKLIKILHPLCAIATRWKIPGNFFCCETRRIIYGSEKQLEKFTLRVVAKWTRLKHVNLKKKWTGVKENGSDLYFPIYLQE